MKVCQIYTDNFLGQIALYFVVVCLEVKVSSLNKPWKVTLLV